MCTSSVFFSSELYGICACDIQFSEDMCTSGLGVLTYKEVLGERSTGENDLLRSVLVTHREAFLVILTYMEVLDGV